MGISELLALIGILATVVNAGTSVYKTNKESEYQDKAAEAKKKQDAYESAVRKVSENEQHRSELARNVFGTSDKSLSQETGVKPENPDALDTSTADMISGISQGVGQAAAGAGSYYNRYGSPNPYKSYDPNNTAVVPGNKYYRYAQSNQSYS